jgi:energy-coupling factor transporter ATP-binding protein EcfA2
MEFKRVTLLAGHYGSGKTNIAVNLAMLLRQQRERVAIADLDIVNPYFRTKDSQRDLEQAGIRFICSEYANSNVDIPALPQTLYAVTDDRQLSCILDVGGDDRGALALGRIAPALREENDFEMLFVVNFYRPLTANADDALEVLREIEAAGHLPFTGVVNNSNLGDETTPDVVLRTAERTAELCEKCGLPLRLTTVNRPLVPALRDAIPNLIGLDLQAKIR